MSICLHTMRSLNRGGNREAQPPVIPTKAGPVLVADAGEIPLGCEAKGQTQVLLATVPFLTVAHGNV